MDLSDLYDNISIRLSQKGITAKTMLKDLNMSKNFLSLVKKGEANPTLNTLHSIAEYLDCSIKFLLYGDSENCEAESSSESVLLTRYRVLDTDGKNIVQVAALNEWRRMEQQLTVSATLPPTEKAQGQELVSNDKDKPSGIATPGKLNAKHKKAQ